MRNHWTLLAPLFNILKPCSMMFKGTTPLFLAWRLEVGAPQKIYIDPKIGDVVIQPYSNYRAEIQNANSSYPKPPKVLAASHQPHALDKWEVLTPVGPVHLVCTVWYSFGRKRLGCGFCGSTSVGYSYSTKKIANKGPVRGLA